MQTNGQFELYILLAKSYLFRFEQNRGNAVEFFHGQIHLASWKNLQIKCRATIYSSLSKSLFLALCNMDYFNLVTVRLV